MIWLPNPRLVNIRHSERLSFMNLAKSSSSSSETSFYLTNVPDWRFYYTSLHSVTFSCPMDFTRQEIVKPRDLSFMQKFGGHTISGFLLTATVVISRSLWGSPWRRLSCQSSLGCPGESSLSRQSWSTTCRRCRCQKNSRKQAPCVFAGEKVLKYAIKLEFVKKIKRQF